MHAISMGFMSETMRMNPAADFTTFFDIELPQPRTEKGEGLLSAQNRPKITIKQNTSLTTIRKLKGFFSLTANQKLQGRFEALNDLGWATNHRYNFQR